MQQVAHEGQCRGQAADEGQAARERQARERFGLVGVWLTRLRGDPLSTQWWKQGGEGEVKVAKRLALLLEESSVHLLHDRRAPGRTRANICLLYTSPSPRDPKTSRMPSSA